MQSCRMKTWDQLHKSFLIYCVLAVVVAPPQEFAKAMSVCSNSFRFDQLCPDPRFGSRESAAINSDTSIHLNGRRGSMNSSPSYSSYASTLSLKEPATSSCDFYRNGMETAVITAIHTSDNPWNFRHANACSHIVKISYDLFEGNETTGGGRVATKDDADSSDGIVCQKEIGIRRYSANSDASIGDSQGFFRKASVYLWHNFTILPHSATFSDIITNYHLSKEDIACSRDPHFIQMAVVISKGGRCEILIQQYKLEKKRSPWGCTSSETPIPYPIQFCGSYDCSQINNIVTGLKLLSRRDTQNTRKSKHGNTNLHRTTIPDFQQSRNQQGTPPRTQVFAKQRGYEDTTLSFTDEENQNRDNDKGQLPPCITTDGTVAVGTPPYKAIYKTMKDEDEEEPAPEEQVELPTDWRENVFCYAFPIGGIILIVVVLNVLRSKTAKEILLCSGYSYPDRRAKEGSFQQKGALPT